MVRLSRLIVMENAGNAIEQTSSVGLCANTVVGFADAVPVWRQCLP